MKLIPLSNHSKVPMHGDSWRNRISDDPEMHERWYAEGYNLGLPTGKENNIIIADFDSVEPARAFYQKHMDIIRTMTLTRRGVHFWFAGSGASYKFEHGDILADLKYAVIPPSVVYDKETRTNHVYRFVEQHEVQDLCDFNPELFPAKVLTHSVLSEEIKYVRAYIKKITAVAGQNGHNATFRVACKLRDSGLGEAEALAEMIEWNETNADPMWSVKELLHKVRSAFSKPKSSCDCSQEE